MKTDAREQRIARKDFPDLSNFLRGYLHEDYRQEHGSALKAAEAFRRVATEPEREAVAAELERFLERVGTDRQTIVGGLSRLGAGWRPKNYLSLQRLLGVIAGD